MADKKKISIFGSTGSIGCNAIDVINSAAENFEVVTLVAKNNAKKLIEQALQLKPAYVVIENEQHFSELKTALSSLKNCQIMAGKNAVLEVAAIKVDLMISAIVGAAAMLPTITAINAGSNIALANKESLVCAGEFIMKAAAAKNVQILPVDSEHNAIFQIFENQNFSLIEDITLTASGGPFFASEKNPKEITVAQALKHPNWVMGKKITIDSATMMNKGLEMIEAFHLFQIKSDKIKILVHPQSILHGMVNYRDGSTLAMLSVPDMRVPLSHAMSYPQRMAIKHERLDLAKLNKLEFFEVNHQKFPAVKICYDALKIAKTAPAVLNAANEIAVESFLAEKIRFDQITEIISKTLEKFSHYQPQSIDDVIACDQEARVIAQSFIS